MIQESPTPFLKFSIFKTFSGCFCLIAPLKAHSYRKNCMVTIIIWHKKVVVVPPVFSHQISLDPKYQSLFSPSDDTQKAILASTVEFLLFRDSFTDSSTGPPLYLCVYIYIYIYLSPFCFLFNQFRFVACPRRFIVS